MYPLHQSKPRLKKGPKHGPSKKHKEEVLTISGLIPGMAVHFAGCCHPIPGDHIMGIVTTGKGVTIHTSDCEVLEKFIDTPERWIDVAWSEVSHEKGPHAARVALVVIHQPGTIAAITAIIARENANIINFKIKNRTLEFYEVNIDIDVKNVDHLMGIMAALRMSQRVLSVERS